MAIRNIVRKGDEILSKKCKDVTVFDEKLHLLLDDMVETMENADGVGLAAPQIGILRRIAVAIDVDTDELYELVNPEIVEKSGNQNDVEGCLSIPGVYGYVDRPKQVSVKALDRNGKPIFVEAKDFLARVFSHEIDHLYGNLFDEKITEIYNPDEEE